MWRAPTPAVWSMTATLDAAMLVLHGQMLAGQHHVSSVMWLGLALVTSQLIAAAAALTGRFRLSG